jgi:ketosteroid isomerase-like protein
MSDTLAVGKKLVELCKEGKNMDAINALYHPNIVSVEAGAPPNTSPRSEGVAAVKGKGEWWMQNHEVHKAEVDGPFPHGDRFIVRFKYDVTAKAGPMAGKRFTMDEAALYTVKDGKIAHEEFFYSMG